MEGATTLLWIPMRKRTTMVMLLSEKKGCNTRELMKDTYEKKMFWATG